MTNLQEFGCNAQGAWEISLELFLNLACNLVLILPCWQKHFCKWQSITFIMHTCNCKLTKILAIKYINLIGKLIYYYKLTLFRLVQRLLTKRLFLLCIENTCNVGSGVSLLEIFWEIYILFSELNCTIVGEILICHIEYY